MALRIPPPSFPHRHCILLLIFISFLHFVSSSDAKIEASQPPPTQQQASVEILVSVWKSNPPRDIREDMILDPLNNESIPVNNTAIPTYFTSTSYACGNRHLFAISYDWGLDPSPIAIFSGTLDESSTLQWKPLPSSPSLPLYNALSHATQGNFLYLTGGALYNYSAAANFFTPLAAVQRFHVDANTWQPLPPMNVPRVSHFSFVLSGRLYAMGGKNDDADTLNSGEYYDVSSGTWTLVQGMWPGALQSAALGHDKDIRVAVAGNKLYTVDYDSKEIVEYDEVANTWKQIGFAGRSYHLSSFWRYAEALGKDAWKKLLSLDLPVSYSSDSTEWYLAGSSDKLWVVLNDRSKLGVNVAVYACETSKRGEKEPLLCDEIKLNLQVEQNEGVHLIVKNVCGIEERNGSSESGLRAKT